MRSSARLPLAALMSILGDCLYPGPMEEATALLVPYIGYLKPGGLFAELLLRWCRR